jgi:ABC-2 type transport system ATP-binding protein
MEMVIEVEKLEKTFRTKVKGTGLRESVKSLFSPAVRHVKAVDDISFSVKKGELLAFIGPNGAGKSTTIKLITGILYPDSGTIAVLGLDPHRHRKKLAYRIGTVFGQKSQLWFHLPPLDSLYLLGSIYDMKKKEIGKKIDFLSEIFEIEDLLDVPVRKLSLGQRIRCEIAASLLHGPEILFLDEPTIGLDVVVKQRIRDLIKQINQKNKVTIFLTSHDAGDIEKICKRAIVINNGRIVWDGTIKRMKYRLLNRRIIDLRIDSPLEVSIPGVKVLKIRDYSAKLEVNLDEVSLEDAIPLIIRHNKILDINISNPPMEEVISTIYSGNV